MQAAANSTSGSRIDDKFARLVPWQRPLRGSIHAIKPLIYELPPPPLLERASLLLPLLPPLAWCPQIHSAIYKKHRA